MRLTSRESGLALATLTLLVFAGSWMLVKPRIEEWKRLRIEQQDILTDIELSRRLVETRAKSEKEYNELSQVIPQYPANKKMDIHWLSIMDRAAAKRGVRISKRQVGDEKQQGVVYELPIERVEWEGTLDAIVYFLFDLQYEGAMLDVRQLLIKPKGRGVLRGKFSLYCGYTREQAPDAEKEP